MVEELFSVEFDENDEMNIEFAGDEETTFPMALSEGGGGTEDAVRYNPQELTEEQKAQARANIGGASVEDFAVSYFGCEGSTDKVRVIHKEETAPEVFVDSETFIPTYEKVSQLQQELGNKQPKGNYVTEEELVSKGYAKQTDVNNLSKEIADLKASGIILIQDGATLTIEGSEA